METTWIYLTLWFSQVLSQSTTSETQVYKGNTSGLIPRLNCTLGRGIALPCEPTGCYTEILSPTKVNNTDVCLAGNHRVIKQSDHTVYETENSVIRPLPLKQWLLIRNPEDQCQSIMAASTDDAVCIRSGFCDSLFPWYLSSNTTLPRQWGEEINSLLCMTDTTSRSTAVCCQQPVRVTIRSCGFYYLYKIEETIPYSALGNVCTAPLSVSRLRHPPMEVKYTVDNGKRIPKRLEELTSDQRDNIVTTTFGIIVLESLNIRTALKKYKEALIKKLNGYYLKRSKRYGQRLMKPLHIDNIKTILGSPEVSEGKLFYTFYVESDSGEIINQLVITKGTNLMSNTQFTSTFFYILKVNPGLSPLVSYYQSSLGTTPTVYREAVSAGNTSQATDWLIILYILGFTVIAIVAILIVLGVYRCILKKAIHRNRAHQLSKVEQILLCDRRTSIRDHPDNVSMTLRPDTMVFANGSNATLHINGLLSRRASAI